MMRAVVNGLVPPLIRAAWPCNSVHETTPFTLPPPPRLLRLLRQMLVALRRPLGRQLAQDVEHKSGGDDLGPTVVEDVEQRVAHHVEVSLRLVKCRPGSHHAPTARTSAGHQRVHSWNGTALTFLQNLNPETCIHSNQHPPSPEQEARGADGGDEPHLLQLFPPSAALDGKAAQHEEQAPAIEQESKGSSCRNEGKEAARELLAKLRLGVAGCHG
jgi:hypothetical protein